MEKHYTAQKTYRYEIQEQAHEHLLIALHGYGQLAKFFLRKFQGLQSKGRVVAPEGPHRFYLQGSSGRVGASWMTKEARELDIQDNLVGLNALLSELQKSYSPKKITLLGFSQGAATAARWYQQNPSAFNELILWAAVFPPDIDAGSFPTKKPLHFVLGTQDEYYQGEAAQQLLRHYQSMGFKVHTYAGKHDIDGEVLKRLLD
ncbi:MAG: alpha/beta fold hydrolase [Flavobacteriia bacterium]|jgi:predicted esterase|nr:alpha/beta fold hydrolase [Flavobacteriia bacterium]